MTKTLVVMMVVLSSGCAVVKTSRTDAFGRAPAPRDCSLEVLRGKVPGYDTLGSQVIEGTTFMTAAEAERIARAEGCAANADAVLIASESYDNPEQPSQVVMVLLKKRSGTPVVTVPAASQPAN